MFSTDYCKSIPRYRYTQAVSMCFVTCVCHTHAQCGVKFTILHVLYTRNWNQQCNTRGQEVLWRANLTLKDDPLLWWRAMTDTTASRQKILSQLGKRTSAFQVPLHLLKGKVGTYFDKAQLNHVWFLNQNLSSSSVCMSDLKVARSLLSICIEKSTVLTVSKVNTQYR